MLENFALHATSPYCIHPSKRRAWLEKELVLLEIGGGNPLFGNNKPFATNTPVVDAMWRKYE